MNLKKYNATPMRFILICLAAVLLSGCDYKAGNKVNFESDLSYSSNVKIRELAGKTFYITNENDYQRLVQLKTELRMLSYKLPPNRFEMEDRELKILQITDEYHSAKTTKETTKRYSDHIAKLIVIFLIIFAPALWPKSKFWNPPKSREKKNSRYFGR